MPGLDDCYVFVESRDAVLAENFLVNFARNLEEAADDYLVPQYSNNPNRVLQIASELIEYMSKNPNETHSIYWNNKRYWSNKKDVDLHSAMVFFTSGGCMIFGLSCDSDSGYSIELLEEMKRFFKSDIGYVAFEEPPADTSLEFLRRVKQYRT